MGRGPCPTPHVEAEGISQQGLPLDPLPPRGANRSGGNCALEPHDPLDRCFRIKIINHALHQMGGWFKMGETFQRDRPIVPMTPCKPEPNPPNQDS